jgi:hypothetical protein
MKIPKRKHYKTKEFRAKNNRRCELIHKDNRDGLTKEEKVELETVSKEVSDYIAGNWEPIRWRTVDDMDTEDD